MNCERTTDLLSDRLKGLLSDDDARGLDAHLAHCPACRAEADAIASLWDDMGVIEEDVPHERMRARFHAALAAYEARSAGGLDRLIERCWPRRPALQAALAAALLVVGLVAGRWLPSPVTRDVAALREEVRAIDVALLDHPSASERLRAVQWSRRIASDARVLDALLDSVRRDPSLNVRLAAVEALSEHLDRVEIRSGLTAALDEQDAPLMQVTLADVLLGADVGGAIPAVRRLLDRQDLDPAVRDHLRAALQEAGDGPAPAGLL
jgi:hypothetical protein